MKFDLKRKHICSTQIEHLTVTVGNDTILNDINLTLHCGELTAIVGRNGAGKTTFMKALLGEMPYKGNVYYERSITEYGITKTVNTKRKPKFGYVPQKLAISQDSPVSVYDLVHSCLSRYPVWLPQRKKDYKLVKEVLSSTNTQNLMSRRVGELSGGEIQRVMLALAIHPIPDILFLDEPVSGVDRNGIIAFYELVSKLRKEYDTTILLISHDLDLVARHADRVVLIDHGVAACGNPHEVYKSKHFIETFGHIVEDNQENQPK